MASIEYTPIPAVLEGIRGFAKPVGFRKVRTRFRLVTDDGHALVLHGMDGRGYEPDGDRSSRWYLAVCPAPYVQLHERIYGGRSAGDPMKFDPSDYMIDFSPRPRPGQDLLGYNSRDPEDVAAFVNHIGSWLTSVALPMARACLAEPRMILDLIEAGPGRRVDRVPHTFLRVGHLEVPITVLLAAECGDEQRARDAFDAVVETASWNALWARFVDPLRDELSKHHIEV